MRVFTYQDYCKYKSAVLANYKQIKEEIIEEKYNVEETDRGKNSVKDVHDKLYRDFFNDSKEFSIFLKQFMQIDIEANKLNPYNNAFITEDYKNRRSDIVYKIEGEQTYILLEHQSSIDYSISYRIFEYYSNILKSTIDLKKAKNKNYKYPVIIPILLYTGNKNWKLSPMIENKEKDNPFKHNILEFRYKFINIYNYEIETLLNAKTMISYLLATDKCKTIEELLNVLEKISEIVTDNEQKQKIQRLIIFIYKDYLKKDKQKELLEKFKERDEVSMKYAWDYVREDMARKEEKVRKEGFVSALQKIVTKMIEKGESIDKIKEYSGFSEKEINKIKEQQKINMSI